MKKVLLVEDEVQLHIMLSRGLKKYEVEVLAAKTTAEGEMLFDANREDICLVVMDGDLGLDGGNTLVLARTIRAKGYSGLMLANSASIDMQACLGESGCDVCSIQKLDTLNAVRQLLKLPVLS
ncbi:MAG: hypothetical protein PHP03_03365 [Candidatus Pacebacteria bacterium]|nr:hypothetical protein [Candidatus Paceibacterota bacterium]